MRALVVAVVLAASARVASAFCGFYVADSNQPMFNDATQVVMMREGTRTVLAMQNNYKGPLQDFAMVIPVPTVLHEGDVKTLNKDVFAHVDAMGAPRLVEYWEEDPCERVQYEMDSSCNTCSSSALDEGKMGKQDEDKDHGVTVEAKFVVGEYQIVILGAKDSTGLAAWLADNKYKVPDAAAPLLRPYVEAGMKFFVAKVDPQKVKFAGGRAALSPLRFHYDSDDFVLPIRLGLASSGGTQDLIVSIIAPKRYDVANYPNITVPTNLDVTDAVRQRFPEFYAALFDRTVEMHPGSVVTEYAWQANSCDPCPGPQIDEAEFATLGGDVLGGPAARPQAAGSLDEMTLTRLHARYGKTITDDLHFREAHAIVGGRELPNDQGQLDEGARDDSTNNFQARYAIRHPWTGPITCRDPLRGRWGGDPGAREDAKAATPMTATNNALAPRGQLPLAIAVAEDVRPLGIIAVKAAVTATPPPASTMLPLAGGATAADFDGLGTRSSGGCGCDARGGGGGAGGAGGVGALVVGLVAAVRPRRRRRACTGEGVTP